MGPAYSAQFRGLESAVKNPLLSSIFLTPKNPEVSQIPSCLSQKILLIRTIPTVSSVFSLSALGDEKRELPISLFTRSFSTSPGRIRTYNTSLERYSQRESNAVRIVGNGSVGEKLFEGQV